MDINRNEILRYLGYGRNDADEAVNAVIDECIEELLKTVSPKSITRSYDLKLGQDDLIDCTCFRVKSRNLSKNLQDCSGVILFAATLGAEADMLIRRYNKLLMSKAVVMQAAAAAMIEEYCNTVNEKLREEYYKRQLYLRPRFSPGYGDFPLACQMDICSALELNKRIGITLTDSCIMMPSKSVTAVIGISQKPYLCNINGCEVCEKLDCMYRRG